MLQFYYDYLDKYMNRSDFEFCENYTDSAYIAISGESIDELVKPEMLEQYETDKCNWSPRTDTVEHAKYDKRTPGLFKVEWEGGRKWLYISVYVVRRICCFGGGKDKFSCKGVNKRM